MTESRAQQFAAAFTPVALRARLPLRLMRDNLSEGLACSLRCAGELFDRSIDRLGPGVAIEIADVFAVHDYYCGHCGTRLN